MTKQQYTWVETNLKMKNYSSMHSHMISGIHYTLINTINRFHVDDLSSAHVYLRMNSPITSYDEVPEDLIKECAQLTKDNSIEGCKKKTVDIIYTWATNLLKKQDMAVGAVSFKDDSQVVKIKNVEKDREIVKRLTKTKVEKDIDLKGKE